MEKCQRRYMVAGFIKAPQQRRCRIPEKFIRLCLLILKDRLTVVLRYLRQLYLIPFY